MNDEQLLDNACHAIYMLKQLIADDERLISISEFENMHLKGRISGYREALEMLEKVE